MRIIGISLRGGAALTLMAYMVAGAVAQSYPVKAVRIISPFSPGSSSDIVGRLLAQKLTGSWSQTVLVENRTGAGGTIGIAHVAKSPPDGYTLLMGGVTVATSPSLFKNLPYDTLRDLVPVILIVRAPSVLTVHPSLPVKSVKELIVFARTRPGQLNYSSSGFGTPGHLAVELFNGMTGTKFVHVPYRGPTEALTELLTGQVQVAITSVVSAMPFVRSGRLRALGVTGARRINELPDLPPVSEAGALPGYEVYVWYGLLAPAATPADTIRKVNQDVRQTARLPEISGKLAAHGSELVLGTPEEFGRFLHDEITKWRKVIKESAAAVN
ncbi:MAG: tripartite tricarboxylate transporter substrate binding protein [Betaproteobacteria bacterium]|nr:tripartite tricarboxylate transporter substrate binding protein [Betaproteobacteria bacterium]MBI3937441.1 tripartite tricarboxylate transporter substrate binding protein [Betaproteobacteria bacterium]